MSGACEDRDILWSFLTNLSIESIYLSTDLREKWPYLQNYLLLHIYFNERQSVQHNIIWHNYNTVYTTTTPGHLELTFDRGFGVREHRGISRHRITSTFRVSWPRRRVNSKFDIENILCSKKWNGRRLQISVLFDLKSNPFNLFLIM